MRTENFSYGYRLFGFVERIEQKHTQTHTDSHRHTQTHIARNEGKKLTERTRSHWTRLGLNRRAKLKKCST